MENPVNPPRERLFSLREIIRITGHERTQSAYSLLRNHGKKPDAYRRISRGAPEAVWRTSVVREVFGKHLARVARLRKIKVEDLFREW
jgi:hypothetical protein